MSRCRTAGIGLALGVLLVGGCSVLAGGCSRTTVKVDGSSTVQPITDAVGEVFHDARPDIHVIGGRSGTSGGFEKFGNGEIDICNASRPISDEEKEACAANGIEYVSFEIAFDGLSVCVNPKNTWCDCLSVEQLKAIWQPESAVSNWSDLDPAWPDEKIKLYGAGTDSGTFDYFTEAIVGEKRKSRGDYTQSEDDNVLVTGVAGGQYSLGYFGLAYYENNHEKLKLLGIDPGDGNCVKPSQETVRANTYRPLSRPLFIYVRKSSLERPEVRAFVEFYLQNVDDVVVRAGYVPAPEETYGENLELLKNTLSSLKPGV
ncbi:MAG: PstS family phosphate ABC transporter substrate-binding protein [Planctomycetes bacterium]|nr:PstS family phosphate ABC transporter substrate-binding protein [Planctomycetota bacterium]